ncbi:MAG: methyltransferase family protein [Candidatus Odinarchaeota archaeon]
MKGLNKLREKLPNYQGKRIVIFPLAGIIASLVAYLFLIVLDILPRVFNGVEVLVAVEPFIPFLGSLFVATIGFLLIGTLWSKRDSMKEKYGNLAYQRMIPRGVVGVFLIPPLVFHAFTSIRSLLLIDPVNPLTRQWSYPLLQLLGVPSEVDIWLRAILSGLFIIFGALTVRSAVLTFGLDYMTVVYLYFPEESEVVDHEIYSILRHPAYFGGVLLAIASLVSRFTIYSIILSIMTYLVFRLQARREEKELVGRFGDSYRDYMKRVPALYVRLRDIPTYLRFLKP